MAIGTIGTNLENEAENSLLTCPIRQRQKLKRLQCIRKCCKITIISIAVLLLLGFFIIFIDFPLVFKYSTDLQRKMIFVPYDDQPEEFMSIDTYVNGTRNLYVTVNKTENITLGVWHFLPQSLINSSVHNKNFNYSNSLMHHKHPVLLHFHGNGGNRIYNLDSYLKLRKFFHVIAFDYRSYGDSSKAKLTEQGIVEDSLELYRWLRLQTSSDNIYMWGHSLGAALATHVTARLRKENVTTMGLVLEAPFTSLREEVEQLWLAKIFSWLPWFGATVLAGLENSGFRFNTAENILEVDCPIMILHAEDDFLIPYTLGEKLSRIAQEKRDLVTQGNVTFHLFPERFHYNHWGITQAPILSEYIRQYITICKAYNGTKSKLVQG